MRTEKQMIAKAKKTLLTPKIAGTWVEGSAKFGRTPGGGVSAGIVFSMAGGMLAMTFGSSWAYDMISNVFLESAERVYYAKEARCVFWL